MYRQHRAAQGLLRHPQARAARRACSPAAAPGSPGCAASSRTPAREVPFVEHDDARPRQVQPAGRLDLGRRLALHRRARRALQPAARPVLSRASAARPAPAPSPSARTSAPAAGGGRTRTPRNAACTCTTRDDACRPHDRRPEPSHERPADRSQQLLPELDHTPPRLARGRSDLHPARGRRRLRAPGAAVLRRQGFVRACCGWPRRPSSSKGADGRSAAGCPSRCCTSTPATTSPK